jgi:hypothetical protein
MAVFNWVFAGFAVVAVFFLVSEHLAHLYGWLPFLLLAACPLMHLFHRGHGSHGHQHSQDPGVAKSDAHGAQHH